VETARTASIPTTPEVSAMTPKEEIAQFMRGEYVQGGLAKTFGKGRRANRA